MRKVLMASAIGAAFTAASFGAAQAQYNQPQPAAAIGGNPFNSNGYVAFGPSSYRGPKKLNVLQTDDFNLGIYGTLSAAAVVAPYNKVNSNGQVNSSDTDFKINGGGNANQTSELVFEGEYKIAPDLMAVFKLDTSLNFDTGDTTGGSISNNKASSYNGFWSREAWLGLASPSWGGIRVGRNTLPEWSVQSGADVFGNNSSARMGDVAQSSPNRANNSVRYGSPNINGFFADIVYGAGESTFGNDYGSIWDGRIGWAVPGQPFNIQAGFAAQSGGSSSQVNAPAVGAIGGGTPGGGATTMSDWINVGSAAGIPTGGFNPAGTQSTIRPGTTAYYSTFAVVYTFPSTGAIGGAPKIALTELNAEGTTQSNGYTLNGVSPTVNIFQSAAGNVPVSTGATATAPTVTTNMNRNNTRMVSLSGTYGFGPHTFLAGIAYGRDDANWTNQGVSAAGTGVYAPAFANKKPQSYKFGAGYRYYFNDAFDLFTDAGFVMNKDGATTVSNLGFLSRSTGNSFSADAGFEINF